jgi:hypothetical protein
MHASETLIPIAFFAALFGVLYIYFSTRHKERMAMIEKGADPALFRAPNGRHHTLKFGMFLVGIATGILLGNALVEGAGLKEEVAFFSMIFLCGGASLVMFHFTGRKKEPRDQA